MCIILHSQLKMEISIDLKVWCGTFIRAMAVFGMTFFSQCFLSLKFNLSYLELSLIMAGFYFFLELIKYYKIDLPKLNIPATTKGKVKSARCYLLFP